MTKHWYKSYIAIQIYIGLAILLCWSIITWIYSFLEDIGWFTAMSAVWKAINFSIGLGELIIILIIYTVIIRLLFSARLRRHYLTKEDVLKRLSDKVNGSCCDESWDILFAQITPYHPYHNLYTNREYYINRFNSMIYFGLSHQPSPDYDRIELGIDGLINVLNAFPKLSDGERDSILNNLNKCSDKEVGSKKGRLMSLIEQIHK